MRIEYKNSFADIFCFQAFQQFLSPVLQVLYFILVFFIFWNESQTHSTLTSIVTAFWWYIGLWVFQFIFNAIYYFTKSNVSNFVKHTIEIQEKAFLEETEFNATYSYWHGPIKVKVRPGFVAVYISPHSAHVIPNRAFTNKAQKIEFIENVRCRIIKKQS